MKTKKQLSIKSTYFLVAIFVVLIVGASFALPSFLVTLEGQNLNRIDACSLNVNFKEGDAVSLLDTFPMSYSDAKKYDSYSVSLTKTGDCNNVGYSLYVQSSCETCEQTDGVCSINGNTCDCNNQIDSSLIIYEFTNLTTGEITTGTDPYTLNLMDIFGEEETIDFEVKLWINENATNDDIYIYNEDGTILTENDQYVSKDFCAKLKVDIYQVTPAYCFKYTTSGQNAAITDYNCYAGNSYGYETITDVVIPKTIDGYTVKMISFDTTDLDSLAYNNGYEENRKNSIIPMAIVSSGGHVAPFTNKGLTSVIIPDTVQYIGYYAFEGNNLTEIVIPKSVTTIENFAFASNSLTSVKIIGKSSSSDFTTYGSNIWGWADGYSDDDIVWNYTE